MKQLDAGELRILSRVTDDNDILLYTKYNVNTLFFAPVYRVNSKNKRVRTDLHQTALEKTLEKSSELQHYFSTLFQHAKVLTDRSTFHERDKLKIDFRIAKKIRDALNEEKIRKIINTGRFFFGFSPMSTLYWRMNPSDTMLKTTLTPRVVARLSGQEYTRYSEEDPLEKHLFASTLEELQLQNNTWEILYPVLDKDEISEVK
ncbi:hypothetical protein HOD83_03725 [Candidatus Woesearchaeota archaeon]|nr:hypothetical protein [Candidatus Woesearchaeota archaeon]MBT4114230.1 hypothetical protein [Candidatus Woesearchaeota archaeon]MBT4248662.1 hypothetical protein [Candidatus Woesearchaeota archaeon]